MRDQRRRGPGRGPGGRPGSDRPRYRRDDESTSRPPSDRPRPAPYPERPRPTFHELFRTHKPVIGVVHLKPLPGSPGYDGSFLDLLDHALTDARAIEAGGATGLIVENFGDIPYFPDVVPPETIAAMTRLVTEVRKAVRIPVGVNVLRNDARAGVAVAAATGAGFVRVNVHTGVMVTDQGLIAGRAWESVRLREVLRSRTLLFADLRVKHAAPLAPFDLVAEAEDVLSRGLADALIITGAATGSAADLDQVRALKEAFPDVAVMVGSGVDADNVEAVMQVADGCIIGTSVKVDARVENPVDPERMAEITRVAGRLAPREMPDRPRAEERPRSDEPKPEERPPVGDHPRTEDPPHFGERPRPDEQPRREERPRREDRPRNDERPRREDRPRFEDRPVRSESARPAPRYAGNGEPATPLPQVIDTNGESAPAPWSAAPVRDGATPIWEPRPMAIGPPPILTEHVVELDAAVDSARSTAEAASRIESPAASAAAEAPASFGRVGHKKKRR